MKNHNLLSFATALVLLFMADRTTAQTVLSYGFESANASWTYNMTNGVSIGRENGNARTGSWSGAHTGGTGTGNRIDGSIITPSISFEYGYTYSISVYAKTNSNGVSNNPVFKIALSSTATNAAVKAVAGANLLVNTTLSSTSYNLFSATITPSSTVSYYVGFHSSSGTNNVSTWIDDVLITRTCIMATANAGSNQTICASAATYTLSGTAATNYSSLAWTTTGTGTFNNTAILNPVYTPSVADKSAGSVILTLQANGFASCGNANNAMTLTIVAAAPASPTVNTAPASVCPPVNGVALSVNPVADAESYSWVSNSGGVITFTGPTNSTSTTVDLATTSNSTYSIHVYAINVCGSSAYTGIGIRRSVSTPSVITGPVVACDNANENYSVNTVGGAETYTWSGPAGSLINGQPTPQTITDPFATITFPSGYGTGTVSVTANVACFVSPARTLAVKSTPSVPVNLFGLNKICPGSAYTYNVPDVAGAVSYNWTVPAGVTISNPSTPPYGSTTEITFPSGYNLTGPAGNICVTAVSQCATESAPRCRSIVSIVPVITSAITANPSATGLCNTTANFSVAANANADEFIWTLPSGVTFNTAPNLNAIGVQIPSGFNAGVIQVTARNSSCLVNGNVRTLNINGTPQTPGTITPFPASVCYNSPAMFSINTVNGATSYQWNITGTGNIISGQSNTPPNPFIDVTWGNGNGVVQVRSINSCGTSPYKLLLINPSCREMYSEKTENDNFNVYPNPVKDHLAIKFDASHEAASSIYITDMSGRLRLAESFKVMEGINSIEVGLNLDPGIYILELVNGNKTIRKKIMVE